MQEQTGACCNRTRSPANQTMVLYTQLHNDGEQTTTRGEMVAGQILGPFSWNVNGVLLCIRPEELLFGGT